MKRLRLLLCSLMLCMLALVGCTKTLSFTYNIENGDSIKVTLTTDKDYKIKADGSQFKLSETGDSDDATGLFMLADQYEEWFVYNSSICAEQIDGGDYTLLVLNLDGYTEYDYCFDIKNSDKTKAVICSVDERRDDLVGSVSFEAQ